MRLCLLLILHDEDGVSRRQQPIVSADETTIEELSNLIYSLLSIHQNYQELYHKGKQIILLKSTLKQIGGKENDEIVIKHSLLPQWTALLITVKLFSQSMDSEQKKMHFEQAKHHIEILHNSKFLIAYADLNQRFVKIHRTLFKHYDRRPEEMQNAAKAFFEKRLVGRNPSFLFADKTEGSRTGTVCTIEYQDITERFYLKTNHDAGRSESPSRTDLDIRELFVYRLLERLGVGATIYFPTSVIGSKSLVYIASREIPEFRTFDEVEQTETDYTSYVHPALQILTIFTVLSIGDCHSKNVGVDNNRLPFIVDFCLDSLGIRSLERDFCKYVRASNKINEQIDEYSFKDRVKVGVNFLKNIEFEKKIDEATRNFIEEDKRSFDDEALLPKKKLKAKEPELTDPFKNFVRPNDYISARVCDDASIKDKFVLSIAENELGVVLCRGRYGETMTMVDWNTVKSTRIGKTEPRKMAIAPQLCMLKK